MLKKKLKHYKFRFYTLVVLPVFLIILLVKVLKTFLRIRLFQAATKVPAAPAPTPAPAKVEPYKAEVVKPVSVEVPVSQPVLLKEEE